MNKLEPRRSHPLIWVLTEVLGLNFRAIRKSVHVSFNTLARMQDGLTEGRDFAPEMAALAKRTLDLIAKESAFEIPMGKDLWRDYRVAAQKVVRDVVKLYATVPVQIAETNLSRDLLMHLPRGGALRIDIVGQLRGVYRPRSIERTAKRIGVREVKTNKGRWWMPPEGVTPLAKPHQRPRMAPTAKNRRARKIRFALLRYLEARPDGATMRDVMLHMTALTFDNKKVGQSIVYREAENAGVTRVSTGFGSTKTSIWRAP